MSVVSSFSYRVPRFSIELPVEFVMGDTSVFGRSENISDTGLLVQLSQPVFAGDIGRIHLRMGNMFFALETRVTHTEFLYAGMNFIFSNEQERQFIYTLVRVLSKTIRRMS